MIDNLLNLYKTVPLDYFRKQLSILHNFVNDEQWIEVLSFDFALNPELGSEIIEIINNINKNKITKENIEQIMTNIKSKIINLINTADKEKNIFFKWFKYREIYAYYGFLETIIEGSIITDYIVNQFKNIYGSNYINIIKEIDCSNPSKLTKFNNKKENKINNEIVELYILMKEWQDEEHVFNNEILIDKYLNAKNKFNKMVYKEKKHLYNITDISLIYLYIIDNLPIVDMNILARFKMSKNNYLSNVIGGKMDGLTTLFINGYNIPESYVIPISSVLNKNYKNKINNIDFNKYAVRSSANSEDGEKHSFAGLFTSKIDIEKKDVQNAIVEVAKSIKQPKVMSYVNHFKLNTPYMAVIIQEFINPQISGVWMGSNINNGNLEWVKGKGEALVSGHVIPNNECWNSTDKSNYLKINNKYIGEEFLKIQKKLNMCCDIEWCIIDNRLVFLQLRAVTKKIKTKKVSVKGNITGVPASGGKVAGKPVFLKNINQNINKNEILLTDYTDPEWVPVILKAKAIVTAEGGALSHTAIIARELNKPAVVGIGYDNIDILKNYKEIEVNGDTGEIIIIK